MGCMKHTTPDGISSGVPYRVTRADGEPPASATDFVGDATVLLHRADHHLHIDGVGRLDPYGTGVHFHQQDPHHAGRDERIWHIRSLPDHQMIAEHVAAL